MTAATAVILGSILGYRLVRRQRAFLLTVAAITIVLVPQTLVLRAGGEDVTHWSYPVVQVAVIGLAFVTTYLGAWVRARRARRPTVTA